MSQKEPSLVKSYLHEHRFPALLFLLFALIFAFVFHLYQLETEAVLYAGALCLLCAAIALVLNFFSYRKKHQDRRRLLMDISPILRGTSRSSNAGRSRLRSHNLLPENGSEREYHTPTDGTSGKPGLLYRLGSPDQDARVRDENDPGKRGHGGASRTSG